MSSTPMARWSTRDSRSGSGRRAARRSIGEVARPCRRPGRQHGPGGAEGPGRTASRHGATGRHRIAGALVLEHAGHDATVDSRNDPSAPPACQAGASTRRVSSCGPTTKSTSWPGAGRRAVHRAQAELTKGDQTILPASVLWRIKTKAAGARRGPASLRPGTGLRCTRRLGNGDEPRKIPRTVTDARRGRTRPASRQARQRGRQGRPLLVTGKTPGVLAEDTVARRVARRMRSPPRRMIDREPGARRQGHRGHPKIGWRPPSGRAAWRLRRGVPKAPDEGLSRRPPRCRSTARGGARTQRPAQGESDPTGEHRARHTNRAGARALQSDQAAPASVTTAAPARTQADWVPSTLSI